jgi:hypothetical protein
MKSQFYKWLVSLTLVIASINAYSQDVIIKNDKTEIKGKVLEVGENDVKYKKKDNPNGPTYSVSKSSILIIIYANGEKETFTENQTQTQTQAPKTLKQILEEKERQNKTAKQPIQKEVEYEESKKTPTVTQRSKVSEDVDDKDLALAKAINFTKANRLYLAGTNLTTLSKLGLNVELGGYTPIPIGGNENIFLGTYMNFSYGDQTTLGIKSSILGLGADMTLSYKIAIPDNNKLSIFAGAGLAFTSAFVKSDITGTGTNTYADTNSFGLAIRGNVNYFITPSIGVYGTIITGSGGGVAFSAGLAFRKAPKQ